MVRDIAGQIIRYGRVANSHRAALATMQPGRRVTVSVLGSDGTTATRSVTLGELPGS